MVKVSPQIISVYLTGRGFAVEGDTVKYVVPFPTIYSHHLSISTTVVPVLSHHHKHLPHPHPIRLYSVIIFVILPISIFWLCI